MKIRLNGLELTKEAQGDLTVRDVLEQVQDEIHRSSRILLRSILDSIPLQDNWQSDPRALTPVDHASTLELIIDEPGRLAKQILSDAESLICDLTVETGELARKYRVGDRTAAHNELAGLLDKLKLVVSGMDLTTRHAARLYPLNEVRAKVEESATELEPVLERILTAQQQGDHVTLADSIEYELPGCIRTWHELIGEAGRIVRTASDNQ